MQSLTFLNAPLLWGLALASIPLIIHLLFRRKFRRVDWAPMHYLKLSIQRNRRRVRLEQLLLLLLRTAAILLLFALVARPVLHASGLSRWLTGRSRASQIVVIDDSLSMGHTVGGHSAIEAAKELAGSIVRQVGTSDHLTLVAASQSAAPLLREVELLDANDALGLLDALRPVDTFVSWEAVAANLDALLSTSTFPIREVTLITDLRQSGWENQLNELGNRWAADRVRLRVFDVGSKQTENVAVTALEPVESVALVNNPTEWTATIHNATPNDLNGAEANFLVDGKPTLVRLPVIPAGETARVPLSTTFQEPGLHHVALQLATDPLRADNNAWNVVNVLDALQVLLVDGEPSTEPLGGESDFLAIAFSLGASDADAFRVEVVSDSQPDFLATATPRLIVLANVASLTSAQAQRLQRLVASGVGLMIFPGEQVDPDNYNQFLFRDGAGLLPAAIDSIEDQEAQGLTLEDETASPLAALAQLNPAVLSRIKIRKFLRLKLPATLPAGVRVLARWNDPAASPAAIEKVVGRGRVLLWTVTADKAWSDWPKDPSYVLAMRESAKALVRSDDKSHNLVAGEAIRRQLPATHAISHAEVEPPEADRPQPLTIDIADSQQTGAGQSAGEQSLVWADTRRSGLYKLHWQDAQAGAGADTFAVNPDARESALQRIGDDDLRKLWGAAAPEVIHAEAAAEAPLMVEGQEIWRTLALGLLGLLVAETCVATWAGRQH